MIQRGTNFKYSFPALRNIQNISIFSSKHNWRYLNFGLKIFKQIKKCLI